jgi:gas vesicle protein
MQFGISECVINFSNLQRLSPGRLCKPIIQEYNYTTMSNTSKGAILLLAGIAAGVTLGLLFAPSKGKENREKLSSSLQNLGETLVDTAVVQIDSLLNFTDRLVTQLRSPGDPYATTHDDIENAII